jgi:hypothetical protein
VRLSFGSASGRSSTSTKQLAVGARLGSADQRAVLGIEMIARAPPGSLIRSVTSATCTDLRKLLLVAGNEHDSLVVADRGRERDAHAREEDGVIKRNQA